MDQIKQAIYAKILMMIQNPHTSGSGILICLAYAAELLWPQKKQAFEAIRGAAAVWLGLNAGDASKGKAQLDDLEARTKNAIETRDTTQLLKKDVPAALQPIGPGSKPGPNPPNAS